MSIKFAQTEIDFLRKHTNLAKVNSLQIHIADPEANIEYNPEYVFLDRSMDEEVNQKSIQTYQWTNKLLIESYCFDKLLGRTLVQISDLPFIDEDFPVEKMVVINGVRVTLNLCYQPDEPKKVKGQKGQKGIVEAEKSKNESRKAIEKEKYKIQFLKKRIKQMENDNIATRTKINKANVNNL